MTNKLKTSNDPIQQAAWAGGDAIYAILKDGASPDQLAEVLLMMCHALLTQQCQLDSQMSLNNGQTFCTRLMAQIEITQKDIKPGSYCAREM